MIELEIAIFVEFHQHGRRKDIVEAPDMGKLLNRSVGRNGQFQTRFGKDMWVGKRNRRHKASREKCSCGGPDEPAFEP
jgi:hypothetical protein